MVKRFSHNWVKYRIWPGERLVRVCWTTHRTKWSDTNAMDTKLKISLSHRTPSVTIQKCGLPGLQSLLEMETQDSITGRPCYQPTGPSFTKICLSMKVNGVIRFLQVDQKAAWRILQGTNGCHWRWTRWLQFLWFQNRIWWRRIRIRKCMRKRASWSADNGEKTISRRSDTSSSSKDTELLYSRKKLHAAWSNDQALISLIGF